MGVSVIDPVAMKVIQFIPTGRGAHGLQVSRDTKSLYVSNRLEGSFSVIDFATRSVIAKWYIPGGGSPDMLQLNPEGTQLWASGRYQRKRVRDVDSDGPAAGKDPGGLTRPRPNVLPKRRPTQPRPQRGVSLTRL